MSSNPIRGGNAPRLPVTSDIFAQSNSSGACGREGVRTETSVRSGEQRNLRNGMDQGCQTSPYGNPGTPAKSANGRFHQVTKKLSGLDVSVFKVTKCTIGRAFNLQSHYDKTIPIKSQRTEGSSKSTNEYAPPLSPRIPALHFWCHGFATA